MHTSGSPDRLVNRLHTTMLRRPVDEMCNCSVSCLRVSHLLVEVSKYALSRFQTSPAGTDTVCTPLDDVTVISASSIAVMDIF